MNFWPKVSISRGIRTFSTGIQKSSAMVTLCGRAFLLTWQGTEVGLDELKLLDFWKEVQEYSWCVERATRHHTHLYIVTREKLQHVDLDVLAVKDKTPNVSPCTSRGRSARRTWDRGHFYVFCPFKNSSVSSGANYMPMKDYAVDAPWIMTLWRQGKMDDPIKAAATYRVLTPTMEAQVNLVNKRTSSYKREHVLDERSTKLRKNMIIFRNIPEVEEWKEMFNDVQHRYKFLWLHGASGCGKTMYAQNIKMNHHLHSAGVDWGSYDPTQHDLIIFDDVYDIESYINMHKPIFQSSRKTAVNTSKTNCFAQHVDTAGKMIVVCSNDPPSTSWVLHNTIVIEVTEPLFTKHLELCNYGENDDE